MVKIAYRQSENLHYFIQGWHEHNVRLSEMVIRLDYQASEALKMNTFQSQWTTLTFKRKCTNLSKSLKKNSPDFKKYETPLKMYMLIELLMSLF